MGVLVERRSPGTKLLSTTSTFQKNDILLWLIKTPKPSREECQPGTGDSSALLGKEESSVLPATCAGSPAAASKPGEMATSFKMRGHNFSFTSPKRQQHIPKNIWTLALHYTQDPAQQ